MCIRVVVVNTILALSAGCFLPVPSDFALPTTRPGGFINCILQVGNQGTERLSNLPNVTQLVNGTT